MTPRLTYSAILAAWLIAASGPGHAQVTAEPGSLAVGRDLINATVNISGITAAQLELIIRDRTRLQEENNALLREKLDLTTGQVRVALEIVGEANVAPERLGAKLVEVAERLKQMLATSEAQSGDSPRVAALKADAQSAIGAGDLVKADALLADVEIEQRRAMARNIAETSARRGELALTRLRYGEAATRFAQAAAELSGADENKRIAFLDKEADALYRQGDEMGDNAALLAAIERYRRLLTLLPRERAPGDWASAQNGLGMALLTLGLRENGNARLEDAAVAFREALSERPRERDPGLWADTQNNLANALMTLGAFESGTTRLEAAVAAHREALSERRRERVPLDWAESQANLGIALTGLGTRENSIARLEEAVVAYRSALEEFTRERAPLNWAATQYALAAALMEIGSRESGTARLEEAVAGFRQSLKEHTRARVPLKWAANQYLLGYVLAALGGRNDKGALLEEAVAAYREALKEFTRETAPRFWAMTQNGLAGVLVTLGSREDGTARLQDALVAYRNVLKELTRERAPLDWATTQIAIGRLLVTLATRENKTDRLEEAVVAFREGLKEQTRERAPQQWTVIQAALGDMLVALNGNEGGTERLEAAVAAYREALKERARADVLLDWPAVEKKLDAAQESLAYALFYRGDFAGAALKFHDAANGTSAYPMLWLYLAETRRGAKNARGDLQKSAAALKPDEWPFAVVELYLGRRSPAAMIAAGQTPAERCEAQFYLGQWQLLQQKRADAIRALRTAAETCPRDYNEYAGALAELKRLGQ